MTVPPELPKPFTTASPINANFSYTDIAEGTGVVVFLGYASTDSSATTYSLSDKAVYSEPLYTGATVTNVAPPTLQVEPDFDVTFNQAKRMKGKVKITATLGMGSETVNAQCEGYIVAKLRKWDGTTETEIGSATGATFSSDLPVDTYIVWKTFNFEIDVTTIVNFASGDTLRITLELWAKRLQANNTAIYLLHDPKNRLNAEGNYEQGLPLDGTPHNPNTSIMEAHVPFLID